MTLSSRSIRIASCSLRTPELPVDGGPLSRRENAREGSDVPELSGVWPWIAQDFPNPRRRPAKDVAPFGEDPLSLGVGCSHLSEILPCLTPNRLGIGMELVGDGNVQRQASTILPRERRNEVDGERQSDGVCQALQRTEGRALCVRFVCSDGRLRRARCACQLHLGDTCLAAKGSNGIHVQEYIRSEIYGDSGPTQRTEFADDLGEGGEQGVYIGFGG